MSYSSINQRQLLQLLKKYILQVTNLEGTSLHPKQYSEPVYYLVVINTMNVTPKQVTSKLLNTPPWFDTLLSMY